MNTKLLIVKCFVALCAMIACTNHNGNQIKQIKTQHKAVHLGCVLLNDSAFKYITRYNFKHSSKDLDTAIVLLKRATQCDSSYFVAYSNMANAYDLKQDYNNEIQAIDKMTIIKKNNWWVLTRKGLVYQKLNKAKSAKEILQSVDSLCQARINEQPGSVLFIIDYIIFKTTVYGKTVGKQELITQIKKHPELKTEITSGVNL